MKTRKLMITVFGGLALITLLGACKTTKPPQSTEEGKGIEYLIQGEEILYIKSGLTEYDFLNTVEVIGSNGAKYTPNIDSNTVNLGEAGKYQIEYSYEEATPFIQIVYVMSAPIITVENTINELAYSEVQEGLFDGVTAKDCFGNDLTFYLVNGGEDVLYKNGVAIYGEHTVEIAVMDNAGNIATAERKIKVNPESGAPVGETELSVDVTQEKAEWTVDLYGEPITVLLLNGQGGVDYEMTATGIRFSLCQGIDLVAGEEYSLMAVTNKGYEQATLTVTDLYAPALNTYGLNNWIFKTGETVYLPKVTKQYERQEFTIAYTLEKDGVAQPMTDGSTVFEQAGIYTYTATPVKNEVALEEYASKLTVKAYTPDEYAMIVASADSTQFLQMDVTDGVKTLQAEGVNLRSGYTEEHGGAYVYEADKIGYWAGYELIHSLDVNDYNTFSFDFLFENKSNPANESQNTPHYICFAIGSTKYHLTVLDGSETRDHSNKYENVGVFALENGQASGLIMPYVTDSSVYGKWLRCVVSIDESLQGERVVLFNEWWGKFYVRNVRYSTESLVKDTYNAPIQVAQTTANTWDGSAATTHYSITHETVEGVQATKFSITNRHVNADNFSGANLWRHAVLFGPYADFYGNLKTDVAFVKQYKTLTFNLYASVGSKAAVMFGIGLNRYDLGVENTAVKYYDLNGNQTNYEEGKWLRVVVDLSALVSSNGDHALLLLGVSAENSYIAITNAFYSKVDF